MKKLSDFLKQNKQTKQSATFDRENTQYTSTYATHGHSVSSQIGQYLLRVNAWFEVSGQPLLRQFNWSIVRNASFILASSFVCANVTSISVAHSSFKAFHLSQKMLLAAKSTSGTYTPNLTASTQRSSTSAVKDQILKRNLFNSDGTLAPELENAQGRKTSDLDFAKAPCTNEKLPVEILGTIFTGNPFSSVVILKDPKIADADIYQTGKAIIDYEDYEIYKVEQGAAEFRKGDTKICVDLTGRKPKDNAIAASSAIKSMSVTETIDLPDDEMKNLLGPELSRAMNEAKLIPDPAPDGIGIQGFRLLAIVPGSVFDRVKLQNDDLLLEVNGQSLKDPGQGYRLLEALQQQREITINFTRRGEPMVRKVRVK